MLRDEENSPFGWGGGGQGIGVGLAPLLFIFGVWDRIGYTGRLRFMDPLPPFPGPHASLPPSPPSLPTSGNDGVELLRERR